MKIRIANNDDIPAIKALWEDIFQDPPSFLEPFFNEIFPISTGIIYDCDGINGMLTLVPYEIIHEGIKKKIHYVYAVGVSENFRGKGIMKQMLDFSYHYSLKHHFFGHILIPATTSLFQLYQTNGFTNFTYKPDFTHYSETELHFTAIEYNDYVARREKLLQKEGDIHCTKEALHLSFLGFDQRDVQYLEWKMGKQEGICCRINKKNAAPIYKEFVGKIPLNMPKTRYSMIKTPYDASFKDANFNFGMD